MYLNPYRQGDILKNALIIKVNNKPSSGFYKIMNKNKNR